MGPKRNPDRPQGRRSLLKVLANFKIRNSGIYYLQYPTEEYNLKDYSSKEVLKTALSNEMKSYILIL